MFCPSTTTKLTGDAMEENEECPKILTVENICSKALASLGATVILANWYQCRLPLHLKRYEYQLLVLT